MQKQWQNQINKSQDNKIGNEITLLVIIHIKLEYQQSYDTGASADVLQGD